jgi:glycerol-3-phosphate acyltransferase PlsY
VGTPTPEAAWLSANALTLAITALISYAVGSIPWAYTIVRAVTGEDVTAHGTGNVGAMNVRRTTGSWGWFAVAMVADALKGLLPVAVTKYLAFGSLVTPVGVLMRSAAPGARYAGFLAMAAVAGAVLGHNYSVWLAIKKRRFVRTGKGLATGGGALLAYDWRYCVAVVLVALLTIAVTRYMMAGQVAAAVALPVVALALRSPDWPFALVMALVVYAAHHRRFVGLLRGQEPKLYIHDRGGPRG